MSHVPDAVDRNNSWRTSDTFIDALFSGDIEKFKVAYQRFVDAQWSTLWKQVRSQLAGYPAADIGEVVQNVLLRMFEVIWLNQQQLRNRTCRFRACFYTWARDAIRAEKRRLSIDSTRRQQMDGQDEGDWDHLTPCISDFVTDFMRRELMDRVWKLLKIAETRVQTEVDAKHWLVWQALREAQKCWWVDESSDDQLLWLEISRKDWPDLTSANGRQVTGRIRSRVLKELKDLAETEGWDLNDLFE